MGGYGQSTAVSPCHFFLLTPSCCFHMGSPQAAVLQEKKKSAPACILQELQFLQEYLSIPTWVLQGLQWVSAPAQALHRPQGVSTLPGIHSAIRFSPPLIFILPFFVPSPFLSLLHFLRYIFTEMPAMWPIGSALVHCGATCNWLCLAWSSPWSLPTEPACAAPSLPAKKNTTKNKRTKKPLPPALERGLHCFLVQPDCSSHHAPTGSPEDTTTSKLSMLLSTSASRQHVTRTRCTLHHSQLWFYQSSCIRGCSSEDR